MESFGAFSIFAPPISRKAVVVERNGPNFQPQRCLVPAEYLSSLSDQGQFGGHSMYFQFVATLYLVLT